MHEHRYPAHAEQSEKPLVSRGPGYPFTVEVDWIMLPTTFQSQTLTCISAQNETRSSLQPGLHCFTGEQDFDLLVVNDTIPSLFGQSTIYQNAVPTPWGGTYGVQLFPGLNNLLVPRGAFLSSPLGQALLNTTSVSPAALPGPLTFSSLPGNL